MAAVSGRQFQQFDWADDLMQRIGRYLGIPGGVFQFPVVKQHLDHPDIYLLFQQVRGEAVPLMPNSA